MSNETESARAASNPYAGRGGPRDLRVWPAVILVVAMLILRFVPGLLEGGLGRYWMLAMMGPMVCCLLIVIWWLAASRATGKERLLGLLGLFAGLGVTLGFVDPMMRGPGTVYFTLPMGLAAFVAGAVWLQRRAPPARTGGAVLLAAVGFGFSLLLRNDGMDGDYQLTLHWRWSPSPEERLLAAKPASPVAPDTARSRAETESAFANPEWSGFRGADRSGVCQGPLIVPGGAGVRPAPLWKVPVGPGWSSFAVAGQRLFTQEQRGPMEGVVCYDAATGREIWHHSYEARIEDPMGGPGPRATPTLVSGSLFVMGATGRLLRLDPATGAVVWQKDLKEVARRTAPMWGFSASPLVVSSNVLIWAGGPDGLGLLAFDVDTGTLRWSVATGDHSYASPQLSTVAGEALVLMLSNDGLVLVDPATGKVRLNYDWKFSGYRALQPRVVGDGIVLIGTPMNAGTRAIRIQRANGEWGVEELWTTRNLKPDFSDLVTYRGHIYGNDGGFLTCLDVQTGDRKWKGGRIGKGQMLLLERAGLLLIVAEDGQVQLVRADPGQFEEVDSFKALEGKTWNHPVVVGDTLYVRNSQEAAAFRWPSAPEATSTRKM